MITIITDIISPDMHYGHQHLQSPGMQPATELRLVLHHAKGAHHLTNCIAIVTNSLPGCIRTVAFTIAICLII
jgi:hypothetical protein